jgi:hypothetical protein
VSEQSATAAVSLADLLRGRRHMADDNGMVLLSVESLESLAAHADRLAKRAEEATELLRRLTEDGSECEVIDDGVPYCVHGWDLPCPQGDARAWLGER